MFTKSEPGHPRLQSDNLSDISTSIQQHAPHVGPTGINPIQPYRLNVDFTEEEKAQLDSDLTKYLPAEFTATRSGPGRSTLTYVEGWKIKNLANKLFGFNGWNSAITDVTVDFLEVENDGKVTVGVSCIVRVTLKDGTFHEDLGYGSSENQRSKAASFEKAKKEAATDGLKRALTSFGNLLGTCLYDKNYCKYLSTQKVDKIKFEGVEVYQYPTEARASHPLVRPQQQPKQTQQSNHLLQQNQNSFQNLQNQQQYKPYQSHPRNLHLDHQQQIGYATHQGVQTSNMTAGQSNPYKSENMHQETAAGKQPIGDPPFSNPSNTSSSGGTIASLTISNNVPSIVDNISISNKSKAPAQDKIKVKIEEDEDDLFFGPDIDDSVPSQAMPESPRGMFDFENIDVDLGDMMNDDSPVKPKITTSGIAQSSNDTSKTNPELPTTPKRSGSFGRSSSSPSLVQTTSTKTTVQNALRNYGPPPAAPFKTMMSSTSAVLNSFRRTAYTPRSISPSSSTSASTTQSSSTSQNQNQQINTNNSIRTTVQQSTPSGSNTSITNTNAQLTSATKATSANVLRANSLAASSNSNNNNSGNSNILAGFKCTVSNSTSAQSHNIYGNSNNHQGQAQSTGLKRPFINNGSHDPHNSTTSKEARLN